jgi:primosomal protein N'
MYIITVIPIQRGIGKETLTYFTSSDIELGSLVKVPLRKQIIDALVILVEDARSKKTDIKSATFTLRKLDKIVGKPFLPEAFMKMVNETARHHAATTGSVLNVLLPKKILNSANLFKVKNTEDKKQTNLLKSDLEEIQKGIRKQKNNVKGNVERFEGTLVERIEHYKEQITENKHGSSVIIVPTKIQEAAFKCRWRPSTHDQSTNPEDMPLIILPSSLIDIPPDISLIIIEDIGANYKGISRPFIDYRFAIGNYAKKIGAHLIEGMSHSLTTSEKSSNIKRYIDEHKKEDKAYTSLGKYMEQDILGLKKNAGHIFILGTRTGHSGTVLCQDCGATVMCPRCNSPFTLHLKKAQDEYNNLLCHHCGYKESAARKCESCGGWRLKAFGLGIEKIEEDIKAFIEKQKIDTDIIRIDSTLKLTPKKIQEMIKKHFENEHSILIGTEILLPYLINETLNGKTNDASYIASLDTLLSLPDFSINDKISRLLGGLEETTRLRVIVQTKNPKNLLLKNWQEGTSSKFAAQEERDKKTFNYPPYGTFVKISVKGRKEKAAKEMQTVASETKRWKPMVFPAFIKSIKNQHILHALITLPSEAWPDEELLDILLSLPPSVTVEVNPRSLL